jgi:hypothetical protein
MNLYSVMARLAVSALWVAFLEILVAICGRSCTLPLYIYDDALTEELRADDPVTLGPRRLQKRPNETIHANAIA